MFDNFGDESGELSDAVNVVLADFDTGKYFYALFILPILTSLSSYPGTRRP